LSFFVLRIPLIHTTNPTLVGMKRGLFMSYMNTHAAFAPAGGIQELSFDEISAVSGAIGPGVIVAWKVGGFLAAIAIAAAIDYYADGEFG
jgi:hypothetical protein